VVHPQPEASRRSAQGDYSDYFDSSDDSEHSDYSDADLIAVRNFFGKRDFGLLPAEIDEIGRMILSQSERVGLDPNVVLALIAVESSGNPAALSHVDARGLMQLLPATARGESERLGLLWKGANSLFDPVVNVQLGISYLAHLVERFDDLETALVAYNWGPTRIARVMRRGKPLPSQYRHRVMSEFATLNLARA
jgi:soluble lytic murein transglycosylase-like protein